MELESRRRDEADAQECAIIFEVRNNHIDLPRNVPSYLRCVIIVSIRPNFCHSHTVGFIVKSVYHIPVSQSVQDFKSIICCHCPFDQTAPKLRRGTKCDLQICTLVVAGQNVMSIIIEKNSCRIPAENCVVL